VPLSKPITGNSLLLRARRERPHRYRAAGTQDEFAAFHPTASVTETAGRRVSETSIRGRIPSDEAA
jgi:hypothetical protein